MRPLPCSRLYHGALMVSSILASRSHVPADSTAYILIFDHGKLRYSTFLPVKPCLSIFIARCVVRIIVSRPHTKPICTFSSGSRKEHSPCSFASSSSGSTAR